ncbi:MAG: ABC transporter permease subunit [Clostridiales bacterium]|nr:ABC transporter permease subunit [Clostridiales bacterium]
MGAIYKRELKSYFTSFTGYIFIAFMVLFLGIYFMAMNMSNGIPFFSYTLSSVSFIYIFTIPVLTMRCFSDEKKSKTDQLLLTAPVSVWKIVVGKFLAMATVFLIPMLISCLCPLIIDSVGNAYLMVDYSSIFAFFLLGCVYISIGMFISSLTESQLIAAVLSLTVMVLLYLWPTLIQLVPTDARTSMIGIVFLFTIFIMIIYQMTDNGLITGIVEALGLGAIAFIYLTKQQLMEGALANILSKLVFTDVFTNFALYDIFDIAGVIYYISFIFVFVFLTIQAIQKRRWS